MKKNAYRCLIAASMILLQPNVIGYAAVPAVTANASAVSTVAEDNQQTESIENEDQNTEEKNDISGNTTDDVRSEEDQNTENTTDENETLQSDKPAEQTQIQSKAVAKKGKWIKNNKGWWYAYEDGTWPKDEIVEIIKKYPAEEERLQVMLETYHKGVKQEEQPDFAFLLNAAATLKVVERECVGPEQL